MLYMCPPEGTADFMQPLSHEEFKRVTEETPAWDIDAVLPVSTQQWCDFQLGKMGFNPHTDYMETATERRAPFMAIYVELRNRVISHIGSYQLPMLKLLPHPTGGWNFQVCT